MANRIQRAIQRALGVEERAHPGKYNTSPTAQSFMVDSRTLSNVRVNDHSAKGISAAYACVNLISRTMASLHLALYTQRGRNRIEAEHPLQRLIQKRPNSYETAFEFWQTAYANAVWRGVGLVYLETGAAGEVIAMHVLNNDDCTLRVEGTDRYYLHPKLGKIPQDQILEIPSLWRESPILVHAENMGLSVSLMRMGAKYTGDGGQVSGIVSPDTPIDDETAENIMKDVREQKQNGATTLFIPFGTRFARVGITAEEAQFLESRKFQNTEICRIFGVPPALVHIDSQVKYSNFEQQQLMFGQHTILPWCELGEQAMWGTLLLPSEQDRYYFNYDLSSLYKADMKTQADYIDKMIKSTVLTPNEGRAKLGLNPVSGGDVHLLQSNMIALDYLEEFSQKIAAPEPTPAPPPAMDEPDEPTDESNDDENGDENE
jgi:HK97 family phage portal protein